MAYQFDALSREFLSARLGKMLTEKEKTSKKYSDENKAEKKCFRALAKTLNTEQLALLEAYQNTLIDRQIHELYFAYLSGLRDGIDINHILAGK